MIDTIQREVTYLWYFITLQLEQIAPYWAAGILLGSAISVFGKEWLAGLMADLQGHGKGVLGLMAASALGILSPLCMYGTIPVAASFAQKGMREDWLAAFMMSSVLLNPQLILYSTALGEVLLIVRVVSCWLCGVAAGALVRWFYMRREKSFFRFGKFEEPASRDTDPNLFMRYIKNVWRNLRATGLYFLLGILLAALFQRYVPSDFVGDLFGKNRAYGLLLAATLGVPLYACGGGTIPLLVTWLSSGMSYGAATSFMITGPATKITNLGALKIVLGGKNFCLYLAFVMLFSLATGLLVNLIW